MRDDMDEMKGSIQVIEDILLGKNGKFGIAHKVGIVWQIWIWALMTLSGFAGACITILVQSIAAHAK